MREPKIQGLEKKLLPKVKIYVGNDSFAFFNVNNPPVEPTDVVEIIGTPMKILNSKQYNFLIDFDETHYFRVGEIKNSVETISVTDPCIVFAAFTTDNNERIKCSGVYHAASMPPYDGFRKRLFKLIDVVRSRTNDKVILKGAGSDADEEYCQRIRNYLTESLDRKDVILKSEYFILGGNWDRKTEFHPQNGQLVTYFSREQKTII